MESPRHCMLPAQQRAQPRELRRPLSQGTAHQAQHTRVGRQSSGEPAHVEETTGALDRRGCASSRTGQGCRAQQGTVAKSAGQIGKTNDYAFVTQYAERGNAETRRLMAIRYAHDSLHGLPRFCTHSVRAQMRHLIP